MIERLKCPKCTSDTVELPMCQIGLVIGFRGRIQLSMNGVQIKLSTNFTFTAKIHIIRRCIPCQAMNWTWSDNRNFPKLAKNSGPLRLNSTFFSVGKHAIKWLPAADRNHVNTSWGDTVKCRLDAGKSPIYFDRKVRVRIYTYSSRKGLISLLLINVVRQASLDDK